MLTTAYHAYHFDVRYPAQAEAWRELKTKLEAQGLRCFETHGGGSHYCGELDGRELVLETTHLFDNQWNTAPVEGVTDKGLRVFDWAKDYESSIGAPKNIKRGHYLDQTEDMARVRRETLKCGYCGHMEPASAGLAFCPACPGSEHLKESDLKLTRLRRICDLREPFAELTEAEKAELLPRWRDAQIHGGNARDKARIAKARAKLEQDYQKKTHNAQTERDGMLWLMDHGINTANVIYYDHTGRFSFGWREPIGAELLSQLLDVISEFGFPYEIKTADGRKLEGNID